MTDIFGAGVCQLRLFLSLFEKCGMESLDLVSFSIGVVVSTLLQTASAPASFDTK